MDDVLWELNPGRQNGRRRRIHWAMAALHYENYFCDSVISDQIPKFKCWNIFTGLAPSYVFNICDTMSKDKLISTVFLSQFRALASFDLSLSLSLSVKMLLLSLRIDNYLSRGHLDSLDIQRCLVLRRSELLKKSCVPASSWRRLPAFEPPPMLSCQRAGLVSSDLEAPHATNAWNLK